MKHTIRLTQKELVALVEEKFLKEVNTEDIEVIICNENDETPLDIDDWIDVPKDWNHGYCPTLEFNNKIVDVKLRNGTVRNGKVHQERADWFCLDWIQYGNPTDIVQYKL